MAKKYYDEKEEFIKNHPHVIARETPNSFEAETAVLGGMLIDAETAVKYVPQLDADDFYNPAHKHLFAAMHELFNAARPIDLVTVVNTLDAAGTLAKAGGVDYISGLVNSVPSIYNIEHYMGIIKKQSKLRKMIAIAQKMADTAYANDPDNDALAKAETALFALAENDRGGARLELISGAIKEAMDDFKDRQLNRDAYRGVPTGFPYLDMLLGGGFQKSDLIILAARPGQGKTSFAMNCAVNAALRQRPDKKGKFVVAVFELEMGKIQLAKRMLCSVGKYDMSKASRAMIDDIGWSKLYDAQKELSSTSLYVMENGNITPAEILSMCRALKHTVGLDFVMIDYLQLMKSGVRTENNVREIAEITRALKLAAKDLNVPILLLSQMSRDIEKRERKGDLGSQLSDLRDSGAIEQDADIVMFIDRSPKKEDVEDQSAADEKPATGNYVWLNIAKHRNGQTGSVKLLWVPSTVTFKCVSELPGGMNDTGKGKGKRGSTAFFESGEVAPPEKQDNSPPPDDDIDDDIGL